LYRKSSTRCSRGKQFYLLGLRGQAKSASARLCRALDPGNSPWSPAAKLTTTRFIQFAVRGKRTARADGDNTPINWMPRDLRYVEKLATPDVTIADIIGMWTRFERLAAARSFRRVDIHYGLLPRANRGIFAITNCQTSRENSGWPLQHHARGRCSD